MYGLPPKARLCRYLVSQRVPIEEIMRQTGYQRGSVLRIIGQIWGIEDKYPGKGEKRHTETLCWDCSRCVAMCSWSRYFIPVEGWTAIPTMIDAKTDAGIKQIRSYKVLECPLFEEGRARRLRH